MRTLIGAALGCRGERGIRFVGAAVTFGMTGLCAFMLADLRQSEWDRAERNSRNVLEVVAHSIEREVASYDLSLQAVANRMDDKELMAAGPRLRRLGIFDASTGADAYAPIIVTDATGRVIEAPENIGIDLSNMDLADRVHFLAHKRSPAIGLYAGSPVISRVNGKSVLPLSRRINLPDGRFGGVATGGLDVRHIIGLLGTPDLGALGSINLFTTAGELVARSPAPPPGKPINITGSVQLVHYLEAPSGTFLAKSVIDGTERFYTYRRLTNLPLTLSVAVSVESILSVWQWKALMIGCAVLVLAACMLCLLAKLGRELRKRALAEELALAANRKLSELAATDGLTGLSNRRSFDAFLGAACDHAARSSIPFSLALVDADHFKRFNDRHGHLAGDEALRGVGKALESISRRPGESACRYGGEEFAVILSKSDLDAALRWGEVARAAVLSETSSAGPGLGVTVSIGIAPWRPDATPESMIAQADAALYAAKGNGRDCVRAVGPGAVPAAA